MRFARRAGRRSYFRRPAFEGLGSRASYADVLRIEPLEERKLLSTSLVFVPNGAEWTNDQHVTDWSANGGARPYTYWAYASAAIFNTTYATPGTVPLGDASHRGDVISASSIQVSGGTFTFSGSQYNGTMLIPPPLAPSMIGTTIESDSGAVAEFSATTVASNSTSGPVVTTGAGTVEIDAGSSATFNDLTVGSATGDEGTLQVNGALNIAPGGVLDVTQGTSLAGRGTINLAAGATLIYESTATSDFEGDITGPGSLKVDPGATLVVGGSSAFSGGSYIAGTVQLPRR